MAQRMQVILTDDIDEGPATQTITFGIDGVTYEIDLNDEHAAALRESLSSWIEHARRVGGRRTTRRGASSGSGRTAKVRAWARENGYEVSDRGRVPAAILEAYKAAQA